MTQLRVGILSQWYDPEPGPASIPGVLARGLVARGHDVRVLTGYPNYPQGAIYEGFENARVRTEQVDGVSVRRVPLYPSHDASALRRLANYLSFALSSLRGIGHLRSCDVVWVYNSPPTVLLPMAVVRLLWRRPVVLHVMDLWPDSLSASGFAPQGMLGRLAHRLAGGVSGASYSLSTQIAYISPSVGSVLASRGVPESKLTYAPVWTDENVFRPLRPEDSPAESGDRQRIVLYAGAIGAAQGLDTLVHAMANLTEMPLLCLIAGDGTAREALDERVQDLGLANVHLLGTVDRDHISDLMSRGDVHVISLRPTPLGEVTLPSKLQATMANAKPILAIASGDLAEVIRQSRGGFVSAPGDVDALTALLRQLALTPLAELREIGDHARVYYDEQFASSTGVKRVEKIMRRSMESDPKKGAAS